VPVVRRRVPFTATSSLRSEDITTNELSIDIEDPNHHFDSILSIGFGREVSFRESDLSFVRSVCGKLGNSELFEMTLNREDGHGQSEGEIRKAELKARIEFLSGVDGNCDFDVSIVASHSATRTSTNCRFRISIK
jgi:hypothetical protein